jgi:hypothetical protein
MKHDFLVAIGFDRKTSDNAYVCASSIRNAGYTGPLTFIERDYLEIEGSYWRTQQGSTEFTFTRFLAPYIKGFYGKVLFCDSDFLWRVNPQEILEHTKNQIHPVWCVKHNLMPEDLPATKKDGVPQAWYPRKNWASLMLFDCDHPDVMRLTPRSVSEESAGWLLELQWASSVGELPPEYNHLVGYGGDLSTAKALHYTNGTPVELDMTSPKMSLPKDRNTSIVEWMSAYDCMKKEFP